MAINSYLIITILGDTFFLTESRRKTEKALTTLERIEQVLTRGLSYTKGIEDRFSGLSKDKLYETLREKARVIWDKSAPKTRKAHGAVFNRIFPPTKELPPELIQHICDFLPASDLAWVKQVDRSFRDNVHALELHRAMQLGYKGEDFAEAKEYLHICFRTIKILIKPEIIKSKFPMGSDFDVKGSRIPEKYIVYEEGLDEQDVDCEATLKKLIHLQGEEQALVRKNFNQALLKYAHEGIKEMCEGLIFLGADHDSRDVLGFEATALMYAVGLSHFHVCEFLLSKGADINAKAADGSTPLIRLAQFGGAQQSEIEQLLLKNMTIEMINHADKAGNTALHYAAKENNFALIDSLMKAGANEEIENTDGKRARDYTEGEESFTETFLYDEDLFE